MKIYHNPRCTKSREALQLIQDAGVEPEIVEYLKDIPSREELKALARQLGMKPAEMIRTNEPDFKPYKTQKMTSDKWITAMRKHPRLIQRPIIVQGEKAVIARPPERVNDFL